jgi:uncharacterized protein (TIGR00299 family) protein
MKTAYLDCFSGLSGDMFLGALLDAGLPQKDLYHALEGLPLKGFHLEVEKAARHGIHGTRFRVNVEEAEQIHRTLADIRDLIGEAGLSDSVKEKSTAIFENLARAEGEIHGLPPDEVHFHELGAVDSILDIVGAVYGMEHMGIQALHVSHLPLGSGFTESLHGRIPVPAPATLSLLKGVPVYDSGLAYEMVTPTGAALATGLARAFGAMPPMVIEGVGYGAGTRDLTDRPNLVRILIGEEATQKTTETVVVMESNLDDTSPEWMGYLMDRMFEAGALDVVFCPVQMKKNRPGTQIQVMCIPSHEDRLMDILFQESTTLGIRFRHSQRRVLKRSTAEVESPWGNIQVKKVLRPDGASFFLPEYESCKEMALKTGRPLRDIFCWVMALNKGA